MINNMLKAVVYYVYSLYQLLTHFNWWVCILLLFKKDVCVTHKSGYVFFIGSIEDIIMIKEVLSDKCHEQVRSVNSGDVVVDIGAGIGDFAISAGSPASHVYSYECNSEKTRLFKKNIAANNVSNVTVHTKRAQGVRTILAQVGSCDFFKIDCEGCEYHVFKNFSKSEARRIRFIAMEVHRFNAHMSNRYLHLIHTLKRHYKSVIVIPTEAHPDVSYVYAFGKKN